MDDDTRTPEATSSGPARPGTAPDAEALTDPCGLFRRCLRGRDGDDWRRFVELIDPKVRAAARRALRRAGDFENRDEIDELAQEIYCRLLPIRSAGFRGEGDQLWSYLGRVADHLAVDRRRARLAAKRRPGPQQQPGLPPRRPDNLPCPGGTPEERLLADELRRGFLAACRRALGSAAGRRLTVARLALLEGWSSREIAVTLGGGLTPGQIDSLLCRLKRRLSDEGFCVPRRRAA